MRWKGQKSIFEISQFLKNTFVPKWFHIELPLLSILKNQQDLVIIYWRNTYHW